MKTCAVCHRPCDPYTQCCPACGEASWVQADEPSEVPTVRLPSTPPGPDDPQQVDPELPETPETPADRRRPPPRRGARQRPA